MSGGLETYTQSGAVRDKATLTEYLNAYLYVLPYGDLGFAAKAAAGGNTAELNELCAASKAPEELRSGSLKLGARFAKAVSAIGDFSFAEGKNHYSVAAGLLIKEAGSDIAGSLGLYCYSQLSLIVNIAVKLIPLRQSDGQAALAEAAKKIPDAVKAAIAAEIDELGVSGAGFDLRSAQHEGLAARLYIS
jgi:urease accessory protein